ncbi:MAG: hypothetical protein IH605_01020 [Burkholderiales bacterium]|nr:hypothetical protein [Burkholderiales bacterium]
MSSNRLANLYFCNLSRKIAVETTGVYVDGFSTRLLPIFDHIGEEASAAADKAWETVMSSPASEENFDPSDYAEAAKEHGLEVYENLQFTRQQLLGLAAAGLYHLWERLLKQFFCKELRGWTFDGREIHKIMAPANFSNLEEFLSQFGFRLAQQAYYADLRELRLVANVVKHGDGKSCEELQASAPGMFEGYNYHFDIFSKADSLELKPSDFTRYAKAVTDFWDTLPENLTLVDAGRQAG